jgi:anti-anti-sigma regulatory factor
MRKETTTPVKERAATHGGLHNHGDGNGKNGNGNGKNGNGKPPIRLQKISTGILTLKSLEVPGIGDITVEENISPVFGKVYRLSFANNFELADDENPVFGLLSNLAYNTQKDKDAKTLFIDLSSVKKPVTGLFGELLRGAPALQRNHFHLVLMGMNKALMADFEKRSLNNIFLVAADEETAAELIAQTPVAATKAK